MTYRVIQWATGNVGRAAIEGIARPSRPRAGRVPTSTATAKAGRDVGEICGLDPVGVTATDDVDEILALDADCVVYSPMLANPREVIRLLASGKNVVTPVGWVYPFRSHDVAAIEAACRTAGVSLHGTGINPGGITEQIPLLLSAFCTRHPPRAGRGVLRHPHLRHRVRRARRDAVRQDARRGRGQPDARRSSATASASRSTWWPTRSGSTLDAGEAHHPRDGRHDRRRSTRRSA